MAKGSVPTAKRVIECSRFVRRRANFRDALSYPPATSTDALRWAWEFLRRNADYSDAYTAMQGVPSEDLENEELGLSIAWNVSDMVDPELAPLYTDRHEHCAGVYTSAPTLFAGVQARIHTPWFAESSELVYGSDDTSFLNGSRRATTQHPVFLAANQVALVITLDANIEQQIRGAVNVLTKHPQHLLETSKSKRHYVQVRPPAGKSEDDTLLQDAEFFLTTWDVPAIKVRLEHLRPALRCVDALAEMVEVDKDLDWFTNEVLETFLAEPYAANKDWTEKEVLECLWFGLRYVLDNRYVTLAATDLEPQSAGRRKIVKTATAGSKRR